MKVAQCLAKDPLTIRPDQTLEELTLKILSSPYSTAAVLGKENQLLGIIGIHDVFKKILPPYLQMGNSVGIHLSAAIHEGYFEEKYAELKNVPVTEFMTTKVDTVTPDDAVIYAISLLVKKQRKALPVCTEAGTFVGMLNRSAILIATIKSDNEENQCTN